VASVPGVRVLVAGRNLEKAVQDLEGFARVWLIYLFHRNPNWKPLVQPPRASRRVGVLATRAPYRPNPIGLSGVVLRGVRGLCVEVGAHDLLDGTPILDIKPYVPYADAFPGVAAGWVDELGGTRWDVRFAGLADSQIAWLESVGVGMLRTFLQQQLVEWSSGAGRKRIRRLDEEGVWEIAYRTWRARYRADAGANVVMVEEVYSGYRAGELADADDKYEDKAVHREFVRLFGG